MAGLTAGLVCCSGDTTTSDRNNDDWSGTTDSGGSTNDGDDSATNENAASDDGGDSPSAEVVGEVVENGVSELENVGDQGTAASNYDYETFIYDSVGDDVTAGFAFETTGSTVAPGERTTIELSLGALGGPSEIAGFGLAFRCGSGVYCQG